MTIATKRNASIAAAILGFAVIGSGCQAAQDTAGEAASSASSVGSSVSSAIDAPEETTSAAAPTTSAAAEETKIAGADGTEYTVAGPILAKYNTLDEAGKTALGAPTGEQQSNPDGGVYQQFDG
ncbi:MAG: repeat-containing protein, partial [Mycobacterium sp.]|nr:repeat-containing protein [Mycobacterium sp.]